jgi:AcrR family transcriptional regulator
MATVISREAYFETGLEVLSDVGYGGLKLAEVCRRLGVTSGSFYHYFDNWPAYTKALVKHWMEGRTLQAIEKLRAEPDPHRRIEALFEIGLELPHGAESAIRCWSSTDPDVHAIQVEVDQKRFDIVYESAYQILQHQRQAELFASSTAYLYVGYEQSTLPRDKDALTWITAQLRDALEEGRFAADD